MLLLAKITGSLSGVIHVLFFYMESIAWSQPRIHQAFRVESIEDANVLAVYVKNQGYYNLFLALGMFAGVALLGRRPEVGRTLVMYISMVMLGASMVLLATVPAMIVGVCLQGVPPTLTLIALLLASRVKRGSGG